MLRGKGHGILHKSWSFDFVPSKLLLITSGCFGYILTALTRRRLDKLLTKRIEAEDGDGELDDLVLVIKLENPQ